MLLVFTEAEGGNDRMLKKTDPRHSIHSLSARRRTTSFEDSARRCLNGLVPTVASSSWRSGQNGERTRAASSSHHSPLRKSNNHRSHRITPHSNICVLSTSLDAYKSSTPMGVSCPTHTHKLGLYRRVPPRRSQGCSRAGCRLGCYTYRRPVRCSPLQSNTSACTIPHGNKCADWVMDWRRNVNAILGRSRSSIDPPAAPCLSTLPIPSSFTDLFLSSPSLSSPFTFLVSSSLY